mmetsp:Transcript_29935/g.66315  ORF Transcript_29935/g.66315 Transcript_29935/m.66315 type:complete len:305 (+) Transcript_29935:130-1044(+)
MVTRIHASLTIALLTTGSVSAFSLSSVVGVQRPAFSAASLSSRTSNDHGQSSSALSAMAINPEDEADAMELMLRARECANSDSCSIDEAEGYLKEVIHIQGSCVAGNLAGHQLCDDIQFASEVVSGLKNKIEAGSQQLGVAMSASGAAVLSPSDPSKDLVKNLFLGMGFLYAAVLIAMAGHPVTTADEVLPFTGQEVWWSIRDGYVLDLMAHYLRHGGLSVGESTIGADAVAALTPQEWWWAARDGYLDDAVSHVTRNGGLLISEAGIPTEDSVVPFTMNEWAMAAKDGYFGNMVSHFFRNGGL